MSNMNDNVKFDKIPQEKFEFVQLDSHLHDSKLETKARGFFADAMLRFSKNKSSVVAAWILLFLVVFALLSPIVSPYGINDKDKLYVNTPSYVRGISDLHLGIMDGGRKRASQNEVSMNYWRGIAEETGFDPLNRIVKTHTTYVKHRGQQLERNTYDIETNQYYEFGVVYRVLSYSIKFRSGRTRPAFRSSIPMLSLLPSMVLPTTPTSGMRLMTRVLLS